MPMRIRIWKGRTRVASMTTTLALSEMPSTGTPFQKARNTAHAKSAAKGHEVVAIRPKRQNPPPTSSSAMGTARSGRGQPWKGNGMAMSAKRPTQSQPA